MTSDQRVAELRLRLKTEKQSIDSAKSQLRSVQNQFKSFKDESEKTNRALEEQASALQKQQLAARNSAQASSNMVQQERAVKDTVDQTTRALQAQNAELAKGNQAAGGRNLLQRAGTQLFRLPSQQIGGGLSTDVIGRLASTLGGLGAGATAAALGIGAAVIALKASTSGIEQTVKAIIATQEEYYRAIKTGTQDSIQAAITEKRQEIEILQARVDENKRLFQGLEEQVGGVGRAISDVLDLGGSRQLREETQNLEEQLQAAQFGLGRLTSALSNTEVATRTAAEAEKKLAEERQKAVDQRIQTTLSTELEAAKLSSQAIQQRIDDLTREQLAIFKVARAGEASADLLDKLTQRSDDIRTQVEVLQSAIPAAQARERAEAFVKALEGIPKAMQDAADSFKRIQDAARKIADVKQGFTDKINQIQQDLTDKIAEAEHDRSASIVEARRDAGMAEAEAVRKAGLDRADLERQSQENIKKILRRAKFDEANAIQDRDAVALDAARQRKKDELATEQENAGTRLKQLDDNLKEQQRTIAIRLREQLRTIDLRYKDQLRVANKAAQKSIELEQKRYQKELADAIKAYQEVVNVELAKHSKEIQLAQQGAQTVLSVTANMWQNLISQARAAQAATTRQPAVVSRPPQPTPTNPNPVRLPGTRIPTMASGGYIQREGLAYLHAGETVVRRGGGGFTFAPTINGNSKRQIKVMVNRELDRFLDDWERAS